MILEYIYDDRAYIYNQDDGSCLTMNAKEMNNLYMAQGCDPLLSKFRFPAGWTRLMPLYKTMTYDVRPIATGIWTGEVRVNLTCALCSGSDSRL